MQYVSFIWLTAYLVRLFSVFGFIWTETDVSRWIEKDRLLLEEDKMPGDRQRKWKRYLGQTQAAWLVVGRWEARPDRGGLILLLEAWPECVSAEENLKVEGCLGGTVEKCED